MSTTRVNFRIPDDLVEKADIVAEVTHKNRTDIVGKQPHPTARGFAPRA